VSKKKWENTRCLVFGNYHAPLMFFSSLFLSPCVEKKIGRGVKYTRKKQYRG
jgi:hypothetical protein